MSKVESRTAALGINSETLCRELDFWFNDRSEGCVVLICGDWGVGKTHAWTEFKKQNSFPKYAEVSLFGLGTTDQIERTLLTQFSLSGNASLANARRKWLGASAGDVATELLKTDYGKLANGLIGAATEIVFARNSGATIMVDDVERREEGLGIRSVLGAIARLKDRYKMRIAILLNEDKVSDSIWIDFKEKVADAQFRLVIAPDRAVEIGLKNCPWARSAAFQFARRAGIQNIRLFQRVDTFLQRLQLEIGKYPQPVIDRVVNSVVGLAWARFCPGPQVPTTAMMTEQHWDRLFLDPRDGKPVDPRLVTLNQLHWNPDEMDVWIDNAWAAGFGPDEGFQLQLHEYLDNHEKQQAKSARDAALDIYHDRIFGGDGEFVSALVEAYEHHSANLPLSALMADLHMLKSIDQKAAAQKILALHEASWAGSGFHRQTWGDSLEGIDEDVTAAINRLPIASNVESFDTWMRRLGTSDSWSEKDTARVRSLTEDDWRSGLVAINDAPWLPDAIARCRRIFAHNENNVAAAQPDPNRSKSPLDNLLSHLVAQGTPLERVRAAKLLLRT